MKRVIFYILVLAIAIVSWTVFARQQRTQTTAAPAQTTSSIERQPSTSDHRTMEQRNK